MASPPPVEPTQPRRRAPLRRELPPHPTPPSTSGADPAPTARHSPLLGTRCPDCDRPFLTTIGLGVHRRQMHPDQANAEVDVERTKKRWSAEELRLMAREEALALARGVRFMNQHLFAALPTQRTLEAIKGARRGAAYKDMVVQALHDLESSRDAGEGPADEPQDDSDSSFRSASSEPSFSSRRGESAPEPVPPSVPVQPPSVRSTRGSDNSGDLFRSAIRRLIPIVERVREFGAPTLVGIANSFLCGCEVAAELRTWIQGVFPVSPPRQPRATRPDATIRVPKKRLRRREYARVQRLMKTCMSRAAREILDGRPETRTPGIATMVSHWGPIVSQESSPVARTGHSPPLPSLECVWRPVTCDDVTVVALSTSSAPGIDGITTRQWNAVPASIKALFFNVVLASGGFPPEMLVSRTVFLPKKDQATEPSDFRPISIASTTIRHLHKILANRLREARLVDWRQRCMDDGCAENVSVLASLIEDSKRRLRELHIVSLDVAKAFDTVSHGAIIAALGRTGLPEGFKSYVARLYSASATLFEVEGARSAAFNVRRGVRQGDPLSTILFCLVVDEVLKSVPPDVGYEIGGCRVNAFAYADDIVLVSSTRLGMTVALREAEARAREQGLSFSASKTVSLSIVPAGKQKKTKVLTDPQYHLSDGEPVKQLAPSDEWRYLGVDFRPAGLKRAGRTLNTEMDRLTRAPLKPQQRLKILRSFLIPRFYHELVLSGTTLGRLRALDRRVREAIRKWLRLPHDTTIGYFHTPCRMGGLGVPSFATTVPGLMLGRLKNLTTSSSPAVRAIAECAWVEKRLRWARRALTKDEIVLATKESRDDWWAKRLHQSTDGYELRECGGSSLSTWWVDAGSYGVPGRDYVQYHHVRVNSLPTRIRTSRGIRRETRELRCRAGCRATETAAHVIQACHRTHGGRIKRHDAVCGVLASGLRDAGWTVAVEPQFRTSVGLRKPDLVAKRGGRISVVDVQVVGGVTPLDDQHEVKRVYYAGNPDISRELTRDVPGADISFSSCTLSWRGVWSSKSADYLLGLGLPSKLLCGITTRVLQGSHTNWVRWNKMTGIGAREGHPRVGVG